MPKVKWPSLKYLFLKDWYSYILKFWNIKLLATLHSFMENRPGVAFSLNKVLI